MPLTQQVSVYEAKRTGPVAGSYQNCGCFPSPSLHYMETQDMREASAQPGNPEILGGVGTTPSILL
jgi:hypothetical protein